MAFKPNHTNYELSPYTGLDRQSWLEAAKYILDGVFANITMDDPVVLPRVEYDITYPHKNATGQALEAEKKAQVFEGLTRTMFIAAPVIFNEPDVTIHGIKLADYYKQQILETCTKGGKYFAGTYDELQEMTGHVNPFRAYQQTVETCALVIDLWISHDQIWATYTQEEKDAIADFLLDFSEHNTVPQNWRLFNMLDMAFLYNEGYKIDEEIMLDHAQAILDYYVGDGWYRDGHHFDYYSCWAFNFYTAMWNKWYGYEHMPHIAAKYEANSNALMATYGDFFDKDGFTNMWGRSNIYRFAATSSFDGNALMNNPTVDYGRARRIASGSLMQFLGRDDFMNAGIPAMGFYKQFSPLVQGYSCTESVYWMGKAFFCLHMPADHPFWTTKENNGTWDYLKPNEVKTTALDGPGLCFSNHSANGETVLRTGKVVIEADNLSEQWNYSKLCYNTKYPWESTPLLKDVKNNLNTGDVESQQYVMVDRTEGFKIVPNATAWANQINGILYRKQLFKYTTLVQSHWIQSMYLADFAVPYGIFRVDKTKLHRRPITLTLGSYGFMDNGTKVTEMNDPATGAKALVFSGKDYMGVDRQMAMTVYTGFDGIDYTRSYGTNPDSDDSIVAYAYANLNKQYGGNEPYIMMSQTITKESAEAFTEADIFPVARIEFEDEGKVGAYGDVTVYFKDGTKRVVSFDQIEARLSF